MSVLTFSFPLFFHYLALVELEHSSNPEKQLLTAVVIKCFDIVYIIQRATQLSAITGRKLEAHYSLDKKNRTITLTDTGARFAEAELGIEDLWSASHSYARILEAALKAKEHFINDKDYIVKDGEVVIIDPGTGRAQPRTRWRELLHAAVEAKEGLKPQPETETSCQITYQAFFRLYRKLSGMSGTAQTEEEELYETYGLSVVPVPTNKPMIRIDHKTEMYIVSVIFFIWGWVVCSRIDRKPNKNS